MFIIISLQQRPSFPKPLVSFHKITCPRASLQSATCTSALGCYGRARWVSFALSLNTGQQQKQINNQLLNPQLKSQRLHLNGTSSHTAVSTVVISTIND